MCDHLKDEETAARAYMEFIRTQELRQVKNERDQMSEDLINAENAYADVKKRNEKLKLIINEHKTVRKENFVFLYLNKKFIILEYRNIETFFRRICSLYRRTKTKICCT